MPGVIHALSAVPVKIADTASGTVGHYTEELGIEISPDQTRDQAYETLCHELIHYALRKSGVVTQLWKLCDDNDTISGALEEAIVVAIENFLIQPGVIKFNPKTGDEWITAVFKTAEEPK